MKIQAVSALQSALPKEQQKISTQTNRAEMQGAASYTNLPAATHAAMLGINFTGANSRNIALSLVDGQVDISKYAELGRESVQDIKSRIGLKGQFLNWIGELPEGQLKNLDSIYELAEKAKTGGQDQLVILGIGGSRHTTESLLRMLGKESKVHFYSAIDKPSYDRFAEDLNLDKTQFLVVSKSGGTYETTDAYKQFKKLMKEHTGEQDVSDRFVAMTDASDKSKLRQLVNKGEFDLSGLVHDDVGGRFSVFDDATLFALAYVGVPKSDVTKMLKESLAAQKDFLNTNIKKNPALQLAAFNVNSRESGRSACDNEYFSDLYDKTILWDVQLKNESIKAPIKTTGYVGPAYLHHNAESDLDDRNDSVYYQFIYTRPSRKGEKAVYEGVMKSYADQAPIAKIKMKGFDIESIARFIELRHFETLYTGNLLRRVHGDITPISEPLPEVIQPNVEKYKKNVRIAMGQEK